MAKIINLISAIDTTTHQYDDFIISLLSKHSDLPLDNDEIDKLLKSVSSTVNFRLNQINTRYDGLNLLLNILPRCSKELLSKYASLWMSKAIQIFESSQSQLRELTLASQVLANIVTSCKEIPELQKQISMQTFKQLVGIILNMEQNKRCGAIFYLLATLIYHYKETAEKLQVSLRKIILPTIDEKQKNLIQAGANCFSLLARATERSFKPPSNKPMYTNWVYNQSLLCNSIHVIMDDLFSDIMEMEAVEITTKLELSRISDENLFNYFYRLATRFENLCIFLSTMLRGSGERNSVGPSDILNVLCRGLAITPVILKMDIVRHQILSSFLSELHVNLFMVLNAFIDGLQQELLPRANTILKLYTQTLKWTENIEQELVTISGSKPFKSVKIAVYNSLSLWLTRLGTLSAIEIIADEIIPHLLKDVTPEKNRVSLMVEKPHNLSKRALKRLKDSQYENSTHLGSADVPIEKNIMANEDLCREALVTLKNIIANSTSSLKLPLYKATQKLIVSLLHELYSTADETCFYKANYACRYNLLKVLRAIQMNPHPLLPPPTQYSIQIFNLAMNNDEIKIVEEAKLALTEIEKIVHPCAPTLQFPLANNENEKNKQHLQLSASSLSDDISVNNREQRVNQDNADISLNLDDNLSESINRLEPIQNNCDKNKNNEPMEITDEKNCSDPTPKKQRKLENSDDTCIILTVTREKNSPNSTTITEKNVTSTNSQEHQLNEKSLKNDNCEDSKTNLKQSTSVELINNQSNLLEMEDDSEDEAILGLFCDQLKEY